MHVDVDVRDLLHGLHMHKDYGEVGCQESSRAAGNNSKHNSIGWDSMDMIPPDDSQISLALGLSSFIFFYLCSS